MFSGRFQKTKPRFSKSMGCDKMKGYIFDTSVVSPLLNSTNHRHNAVVKAIASLNQAWPNFVSAVSLGELEFGAEPMEALEGKTMPNLKRTLKVARRYEILDITERTAAAYGELKSKLAVKYLATPSRRNRPRWLEDRVDEASGKKLGVDENDLWICAHARERDLVVVTADKGMQRIADADATLRLSVIAWP